jgi:hypothetical protein
VTVQPRAARPSSHLGGCVGFWLWALVGAATVFGMVSFIVFLLLPGIVLAVLLVRLSPWKDGPVTVGVVAGAGVPLLVVAAIQWNSWHHRLAGDNTPNPYYWGGLGLLLFVVGGAAYALVSRRTPENAIR